MSRIVTGEAVAIDLRPARLGSRMIAVLLDLFIQVCVLYGTLTVLLIAVNPQDDVALATAVVIVVYVGTMLGYPVICETFLRGRTVGKMVMKLRVVRDDGGPTRFRHALVRGLLGAVAERPGVLFGLPAVVAMLVSRRSKRLGDLFAGTMVVHESVPMLVGVVPTVPAPLAGWVTKLDLTGLDDELAGTVRDFLGRVHELAPEARERIGAELVAEVRAVVTPPAPPNTPGWAYLSAVLAERTRRSYRRLRAVSRARYGPGEIPGVPLEYYPRHLLNPDVNPPVPAYAWTRPGASFGGPPGASGGYYPPAR
ncbi:RDD family protein [Frankia sp. CNm7]|uniref:RDD family protein n=1 Tax=Frankia nepalensis TaxID=1836974 RepID=A0A937UP37_9ACTN|nr:RDD family protein [Frankia nepalensis]MBL7496877.1 RDD family protein [Frankia nepalensis]MBL7512077.1 RDD family protein [Frankia nepalensis]MBL7519420.1 RDD family protein [Frankia nepalensis]MBL7630464.1 RDD family protein [Frankia nepalensis]